MIIIVICIFVESAAQRSVICLDVSESIWDSKTKIGAARIAAQAIALAVRDAGGDVVGVLFDKKRWYNDP